jgi:hypothetical protein
MEDPFVPTIIESLRQRGHLPRRDLTEHHAWDQAQSDLDELVSATQLKISWALLKRAQRRRNPELFEHRLADFIQRLGAFLNS